jgi:hypothetical protein
MWHLDLCFNNVIDLRSVPQVVISRGHSFMQRNTQKIVVIYMVAVKASRNEAIDEPMKKVRAQPKVVQRKVWEKCV